MTTQRLAQEIHRLVADLPIELVNGLANALIEVNTANWQRLRVQAISAVARPTVRERVGEFLDFWQSNTPAASAESVSLGLLAAAHLEEHHREYQRLELVWTGPDSHVIPLRRTDQALLQLINGAQGTLHIVSFAVYKIEAISHAIVNAAQRGVSVAIYLETPDASEGRIAFDTIQALGREVAQRARIYVWPLEKRLKAADGKHGSLHAKLALADGQTMLISSANLTGYAMTLNMEMGLLVHGGPLPAQVETHLERLVEQRVFQPV
ncbi:MAG: DISARM system phospholipase D-like protein DrmC [Chloroflexota bacterium]|nr:DISARM system phospholipase D-like protein DrmC [Chloroflexota bacterium]